MPQLIDEIEASFGNEIADREGSVQEWVERNSLNLSMMTLEDLAFELRVAMLDKDAERRMAEMAERESQDVVVDMPF